MRINCEDLFLHSCYLQARTFCIGHSKYSRRGNKKSRVISDRKGKRENRIRHKREQKKKMENNSQARTNERIREVSYEGIYKYK